MDITPFRRWYVVAALAAVFAISLIDRSMITILQEPIKRELGVSDKAMGALSGLAFAAFYATLAVPIGRFADRRSRVGVLTVSLAVWSLATAACGAATSFVTLLLARMLVGAGEAGGYPTSASIISDYFPPQRRAFALALFGLGGPLGAMLGLLLGGMLDAAVGWRGAFAIVGFGGLPFALIVFLTIAEPVRGMSDGPAAMAWAGGRQAPFGEVLRSLWRLRSMRLLLFANMLHGFTQYSFQTWTPTFYIRSYGFTPATLAPPLATLAALGLAGTWLGGFAADRLGRRDVRWQLWVMALASAAIVPLGMLQFLLRGATPSLLVAAGPYLLLTVYIGPTFAATQSLVAPQIRGTTAAIMLMTFNLFGLGLGPFLTGALSDALTPALGAEALRATLAGLMLVELLAAGCYLLAARSFGADMARDRGLDFTTA